MVFIDGHHSHAFLRFPGIVAAGRAAEVVEATAPQLDLARAMLADVPTTQTYTRVGLVMSEAGPVVMEVELTEPWLGFSLLPDAAQRRAVGSLAEAVVAASVRP